MNRDDRDIFNDAINKWGPDLQKVIVIEEMAELTKELVKSMREGGSTVAIAEEIADVEIMLDQLRVMYACYDGGNFEANINKFRNSKIIRLREKIG